MPFNAIKITEHVYWVGAIDWAIRNFHGYETSRGTTYNAFLVLADKVTLIDTVKAPFQNEMMSRIASVCDPQDISYIVSNHSELDHSGCLPRTIQEIQPEKVFASMMGVKTLHEHFQLDRDIVTVKDGEKLNLGNTELTFMETRMLHWPDSMFTYFERDDVLFSQDAFGSHIASSERFDDEINLEILEWEAAKYFANILMPYAPLVKKLYDKIENIDLKPGMIAPDHGPLWRTNVDRILQLYKQWAEMKPSRKAVVLFDTMWQSTAKMADAIGDGLTSGGAKVTLMPLSACHRSDVATEIMDAGALLVGSPTLNSNLFPTVADVLTYLQGLKPQNLIGTAFGSYGWNEAAVRKIEDILTSMKVELVSDPVTVKYVPNNDDLEKCHSLGELVAEKLLERCQQ